MPAEELVDILGAAAGQRVYNELHADLDAGGNADDVKRWLRRQGFGEHAAAFSAILAGRHHDCVVAPDRSL